MKVKLKCFTLFLLILYPPLPCSDEVEKYWNVDQVYGVFGFTL